MNTEKLLDALERFIDAKIDLRILPIRPNLNQELVESNVSTKRRILSEWLNTLEEKKND